MKIFYWCPFINNVATISAVLNSAISLKKYSESKIIPTILNAVGEWNLKKNEIEKNNVNLFNLNKNQIIDILPKFGFLKSRFTYIIIFFLTFFKLNNVLKKEKPEYLIIHLITFIPLLLLIIFKYDTKFILRISGLPKLNFLRKYFWKFISNKIYFVTVPTHLTLNELKKQKIFHETQLIYLPDPILNISEIKKKLNENIQIEENIFSENTLVSIGRLTKQKNFLFLIKNFKNILSKYHNFKLVIIGEGEERQILEQEIKKNKLVKNVFLLGYKKNIYPYLKKSKAFILTSLWEDPGFVIVEAAFCNKTIISSNCPNGPIEILNNGKNGYLFESNSSDQFLKIFEKFISDNKETKNNKIINLKKKCKEFTLYGHFKILYKIIKK